MMPDASPEPCRHFDGILRLAAYRQPEFRLFNIRWAYRQVSRHFSVRHYLVRQPIYYGQHSH